MEGGEGGLEGGRGGREGKRRVRWKEEARGAKEIEKRTGIKKKGEHHEKRKREEIKINLNERERRGTQAIKNNALGRLASRCEEPCLPG